MQEEPSVPHTGLCQGCQGLDLAAAFWGRSQREISLRAHPAFESAESLELSARSCILCRLMQDGLQQYVRRLATEQDAAGLERTLSTSWRCDRKRISTCWGYSTSAYRLSCDIGGLYFKIFLAVGMASMSAGDKKVQDPSLSLLPPWYTAPNPDDTDTPIMVHLADPVTQQHTILDQLAHWMALCRTSHAKCADLNKTVECPWMPDRILDLGSSSRPQLVLLEDCQAPAVYAALSYCWGTKKTTVTTADNLEFMKSGIDVTTLGKIITDAILATRSLGIQYLWIDSFCIIQDDASDWERQSAKMADVYRNAHITIVASCAKEVQGGFLAPRAPINAKCGSIRVPGETHQTPIQASLWRFAHLAPEETDAMSFEPLTTRAWTMQERYLSRRLVHFGAHYMTFECPSGLSMENGQTGVISSSTEGIPIEPDWVPRYPSIKDSWYSLVEIYSQCQLTKASDRLPAFAGMASQYACYYERGQYLAGHWQHDIPSSLYWYRVGSPSQRDLERPRQPSWAWPSVDGPVYFPGTHFEKPTPVAQCTTVHIERVGEYYLGNVKYACLELLAPILQAVLSEDDGDFVAREARKIQVSGPHGQRIREAEIYLDTPALDVEFELFVLSMDAPTAHAQEFQGIVLQRCEENGTCQRIGAFAAVTHDDLTLAFEELPLPSRIRLY